MSTFHFTCHCSSHVILHVKAHVMSFTSPSCGPRYTVTGLSCISTLFSLFSPPHKTQQKQREGDVMPSKWGAVKNTVFAPSSSSVSAPSKVEWKKVLKIITPNPATVNDVLDEDGWTALHYSCKGGNAHLVYLLLSVGAAVDALTRTERTPLMIAVFYGHLEITHILLKHRADLYVQSPPDPDRDLPAQSCLEIAETARQRNETLIAVLQHQLGIAPVGGTVATEVALRNTLQSLELMYDLHRNAAAAKDLGAAAHLQLMEESLQLEQTLQKDNEMDIAISGGEGVARRRASVLKRARQGTDQCASTVVKTCEQRVAEHTRLSGELFLQDSIFIEEEKLRGAGREDRASWWKGNPTSICALERTARQHLLHDAHTEHIPLAEEQARNALHTASDNTLYHIFYTISSVALSMEEARQRTDVTTTEQHERDAFDLTEWKAICRYKICIKSAYQHIERSDQEDLEAQTRKDLFFQETITRDDLTDLHNTSIERYHARHAVLSTVQCHHLSLEEEYSRDTLYHHMHMAWGRSHAALSESMRDVLEENAHLSVLDITYAAECAWLELCALSAESFIFEEVRSEWGKMKRSEIKSKRSVTLLFRRQFRQAEELIAQHEMFLEDVLQHSIRFVAQWDCLCFTASKDRSAFFETINGPKFAIIRSIKARLSLMEREDREREGFGGEEKGVWKAMLARHSFVRREATDRRFLQEQAGAVVGALLHRAHPPPRMPSQIRYLIVRTVGMVLYRHAFTLWHEFLVRRRYFARRLACLTVDSVWAILRANYLYWIGFLHKRRKQKRQATSFQTRLSSTQSLQALYLEKLFSFTILRRLKNSHSLIINSSPAIFRALCNKVYHMVRGKRRQTYEVSYSDEGRKQKVAKSVQRGLMFAEPAGYAGVVMLVMSETDLKGGRCLKVEPLVIPSEEMKQKVHVVRRRAVVAAPPTPPPQRLYVSVVPTARMCAEQYASRAHTLAPIERSAAKKRKAASRVQHEKTRRSSSVIVRKHLQLTPLSDRSDMSTADLALRALGAIHNTGRGHVALCPITM